jgi:hypothetical protein
MDYSDITLKEHRIEEGGSRHMSEGRQWRELLVLYRT